MNFVNWVKSLFSAKTDINSEYNIAVPQWSCGRVVVHTIPCPGCKKPVNNGDIVATDIRNCPGVMYHVGCKFVVKGDTGMFFNPDNSSEIFTEPPSEKLVVSIKDWTMILQRGYTESFLDTL